MTSASPPPAEASPEHREHPPNLTAAMLLAGLPLLCALGASLPAFAPLTPTPTTTFAALLDHGLELLPLGPRPLRAALSTALAAAGCAALLQRGMGTWMRARGLGSGAATALSVPLAWAIAGSGALWSAGPDGTLLPLLLTLGGLERLGLLLQTGADAPAVRRTWVQVGLWLGLAALAWLEQGAAAAAPGGLRLLQCAAGVALAGLLATLLVGREQGRTFGLTTLAVACLGLLLLRELLLSGGPRQPELADQLEEHTLRNLPSRAILIVNDASALRLERWRRDAGARPDVVPVAHSALARARGAETLARAQPSLKGLLRTHLIDGRLSPFELQSLAAQRPVYVQREPSTTASTIAPTAARPGTRDHTDAELDETLLPEGAYQRVQTSAVTGADVGAAADALATAHEDFSAYVALHDLDDDARALLSGQHMGHALYFLRAGDRRGATQALERALTVASDDKRARRLLRALEQADQGEPLDIGAILDAAD